MKTVVGLLLLLTWSARATAPHPGPAVASIHHAGLALWAHVAAQNENLLLSPYSIQGALVLAYAGADGETRREMAQALHYPTNDAELHGSFALLRRQLEQVVSNSIGAARETERFGGKSDPVSLQVANRLFGQEGFEFQTPFLKQLADYHAATPESVNFKRPTTAAKRINQWVEQQTRDRIRDLVLPTALAANTRLVLVNALYFKAPWASPFEAAATRPKPFRLGSGTQVDVPTMHAQEKFRYAKRPGYSVVALPYAGYDFQFIIFLPDTTKQLGGLEQQLTPKLLAECAKLPFREVTLALPRFKLAPPALSLSQALQAIGVKQAFDQPPGSANFSRLAAPRGADRLAISEVVHKTYLALDEKGSEAAAATAVTIVPTGIAPAPPKPIEVRVDRPFLFAIQHVETGACLFLGRLTDPR